MTGGRPRDPLLDALRRDHPDTSPRTIARMAKGRRWLDRHGVDRLPEDVRAEIRVAMLTTVCRWIEDGGGVPVPTPAERLAAALDEDDGDAHLTA